jgi:hypothetical protein
MPFEAAYQPRNPIDSPLYGVVAGHLETFLDRQRQRERYVPAGRGCSAFNPLARRDAELFQSMMDGANTALRGFANRDIRQRLASSPHLRQCANDPKKAQLQSQPYPSTLSRSRIDRQNSTHSPPALTVTAAASWAQRSIYAIMTFHARTLSWLHDPDGIYPLFQTDEGLTPVSGHHSQHSG